LDFTLGDIQAIMKWQITQEHYFRKVSSAFPSAVFDRLKTGQPPLPTPQSFPVVWTCRLKEAVYSPIRGLISTGSQESPFP
jgi:hypothetical protein